MRKSKHMQRWHLQRPWVKPMLTFNLAAIKIQTLFRGCGCRALGPKRWSDLLQHRYRTTVIKKNPKHKTITQIDKYLSYLDASKSSTRPVPKWLGEGFTSWCTVRIQNWWRMVPARRRFLYRKKLVGCSSSGSSCSSSGSGSSCCC